MSFYSGLATTASKLLTDKGQPLTIRRRAVNTRDPIAGTVTPAPPVDYTVNGVLLGYKDSMVSTDLVQRGERKVLIEAGVVTPTNNDQIIIDGQEWSIVDLEAINPAGTPILYKLQVHS